MNAAPFQKAWSPANKDGMNVAAKIPPQLVKLSMTNNIVTTAVVQRPSTG